MYFRLAIEIILALFSVFGIYSALRLVVQRFFGDGRIFLAVEILSAEDADRAEDTIREAFESFLLAPSGRLAVIISEELCSDEGLMDIIAEYGAECYVREDTGGELYAGGEKE